MRMNRRSLGGTIVALILAALGAIYGTGRGGGDAPGTAPGTSRAPTQTHTGQPAAEPDPAGASRIQVSAKRRTHILDGDRTGGGHGPGRGTPGKSEFPSWMSDDDVIREVLRIANDPASYRDRRLPTGRDRYEADGSVRAPPGAPALRVRVVVEPQGEGVITAYPTNVRRNP